MLSLALPPRVQAAKQLAAALKNLEESRTETSLQKLASSADGGSSPDAAPRLGMLRQMETAVARLRLAMETMVCGDTHAGEGIESSFFILCVEGRPSMQSHAEEGLR